MDGSPFQLSPDPGFYFDSHGHHRAWAALRRGLSQASGFTVISGEIGAGKTTVVQAVLDELKPAFFAVANSLTRRTGGHMIASGRWHGATRRLAVNLRRFPADLVEAARHPSGDGQNLRLMGSITWLLSQCAARRVVSACRSALSDSRSFK
jgi:hypothetical protein